MKRYLALMLVLCLALTLLPGCGKADDEDAYIPTGDALLMEGQDPEDLMTGEAEPQNLTLAYNPGRSMNPLVGYSYNNRVLFSLMYQGLFAYDSSYQVYPILCSSYQVSSDNKTWTFYLEPQATFSDGSSVTLEDVYASYQAARESDYYKGRFVYYVNSIEIQNGAIVFFLNSAFENFPLLLDIPILKSGETAADNPLGTGPYALAEGLGGKYLRRVADWWGGKAKVPATDSSIALVEAETDSEIRDEFEFNDVGVVCTNPMSDKYADYRCDYELWDVDSGMFLYLGCNVLYSDYFEDGTLRKVLTYAIDRDTIIDKYYHGHAQKTTLCTPPSSVHYSQSLASKYEFDSMKFIDAISSWTIPKDEDNPDRKLRLLVNCDDSARLRTARYIADALTEFGIPTGTLEYGSTTKPTYETVLRANTFDIYLGQTRLGPNMDLSEFFRLWGNLSWGGIPNDNILALCKESLANSGNYYNLMQLIADDGRIVPILFGTYSIYAERGLLPDLNPSRDNVFFYTMGKTMESARIDNQT